MESFFTDLYTNYKHTLIFLGLACSMGLAALIGYTAKLILKTGKKFWINVLGLTFIAIYLWWAWNLMQEAEKLGHSQTTEFLIISVYLIVTSLIITCLYLFYHRVKLELALKKLQADVDSLKKQIDNNKYNSNV